MDGQAALVPAVQGIPADCEGLRGQAERDGALHDAGNAVAGLADAESCLASKIADSVDETAVAGDWLHLAPLRPLLAGDGQHTDLQGQ
ncbi:hypothetical protein [Nonomuraea sp. NPDC050786]|uniref:hypothetical protein n=1 Tax=Nonomuraea sp. NPDC050786 TaxID=3154840 RepID=UPI0033C4529F